MPVFLILRVFYFQSPFVCRVNPYGFFGISIGIKKCVTALKLTDDDIAVYPTVFPISRYFTFIFYFPKIIADRRDVGKNPIRAVRRYRTEIVYECNGNSHAYRRVNNGERFLCKKQA